jgi:hypothetical protein
MENEELLISTSRSLKKNFYIWYFILIALGIFCFATKYPFPKLNASLSVNFQQLLILCLLTGIPGILVWTKNKMKTLAEVSDISIRLRLYGKYVHIRQSVFFILGFFILFMQVFTFMKGALMLFCVVICISIFITPSRGRLEAEAQIKESA